MKFQNLFLEEDLIKKSKNISITEKQLENFERWFEMLENERLIEEESNYNNFSDYFLKGLLNYSTENIEFQENDVEFSLKNNENKIFTLIELKGQKGDLFKKQGSGYSVSPVQQASLYADKFSDLEFFVVSNYNKFVFFSKEHKLNKKYEIDFLDFKKNNYEKLKIFLYLLSKEFTDKKIIKNEVKNYISKQNDFSKKFYKLFFETLKLLVFEIEKSNSEITRNDAVFYSQKILDRVIFTCFVEDTGIMDKDFIHKNLLDEISKNGNLWKRLNEIFRDMNKSKKDSFGEVIVPEFNGEFFKIDLENKINLIDKRELNFFDKELFENYNFDKNLSDELKEKLKPYSKIFYNIFLISNFNFKTDLNVNILGQIFENSLSDIENLKNEEISKRKKDGIFYTPSYITEYICKNTIIPYLSNKGNCEIDFLIEEYSIETKTINELEEKLTNIKILDPACGSGAFLNKAVEILNEIWEKLEELKKEKGWYNIGDKKGNFTGFDKQIQESKIKEIIKNNIFGVDLNSESCEITKLSLFLKISNKASPKLINLNQNIKCGNSLISGINENNYKLFENDIKEILKENDLEEKEILIKSLNSKLNKSLKEYFGENYKELKPFNWEIEFIDIFFEIDENDNLIRKGFDIVIGNPPYVDSENMTKNNLKEREYISKKYQFTKGNWDLYIPFIEKSFKLLRYEGFSSLITPNKWLSIGYGKETRKQIEKNLFELSDLQKINVFEDAGVFPIIFFFNKKENNFLKIRLYYEEEKYKKNKIEKEKFNNFDNFGLFFSRNIKLIQKLLDKKKSLNSISKIQGAFSTSEAYELIPHIKNYKNENNYLKFINTGTIDRYINLWNLKTTIYIKKKYFKPIVLKEDFQKNFKKRFDKFKKEKIIISGIRYFESILDKHNEFLAGKSTTILKDLSKEYLYEYILTILNSKLISFFLKECFSSSGMDGGISFSPEIISKIPIPEISKEEQKPFIEKADLMLELNKKFYDEINFYLENLKVDFEVEKISKKLEKFYLLEKNEFLKELKKISKKEKIIKEYYNRFENIKNEILEIKNKIDLEEKIIDKMVYEIYELNEDEIKIIEDS